MNTDPPKAAALGLRDEQPPRRRAPIGPSVRRIATDGRGQGDDFNATLRRSADQ